MHLEDGLPWSIPVTLSLDEDEVKRIGAPRPWPCSRRRAPSTVIEVTEIFKRDRQKEALGVFRTEDLEHPGVKALHEAGTSVWPAPCGRSGFPSTTTSSRTASPPRRRGRCSASAGGGRSSGSRPATRSTARTSTSRSALEIVDGLLVHPLMGATKGDDVPADVRMQCYEALFAGYYPKDRATISVFPAAMRYAGPREAICTRPAARTTGAPTSSSVATTPASEPTTAPTTPREIFEEFEPGEPGITPLMFEHSFWCDSCEGMASPKTCPHGEEARVSLGHAGARDAARGRAPTGSNSRGPRSLTSSSRR